MNNLFIKSEFEFSEDEEGRITGYASVFGNVDSYGDVIEHNAFDNILDDLSKGLVGMPLMLANHDHYSGCPIGIWDSLKKDDKGLVISGLINKNIQRGAEIYSSLKFSQEKQVKGMGLSVGFYPDWDSCQLDENDLFHIKNIKELKEVSIVNFPANAQAVITSVKNDRDSYMDRILKLQDKRDCEKFMRDVCNLSKKEAETLISVFSNKFSSAGVDTLNELNAIELMNRLNNILRN